MLGKRVWTEEHRQWETVNYSSLKDGSAFPKEFMWGVATASHQIEGGLKLVIGYEMQEDNSCRLTASIK